MVGKSVGIVLSVTGLLSVSIGQAKTIIADPEVRHTYITNAFTLDETVEDAISTKDMFNGPKNPYDLVTHQTIDCNFQQPDPEDPIGGTTPKFMCLYKYNGEDVELKIKYDQQYNSVYEWSHSGNEEVYASVISQRILWSLGFGSDQSVPLTVNCHNCPIEPWTYIQVIQGYDNEDALSGWMDMGLVKSGKWNQTADVVTFNSTIAYFKYKEYVDGDEIHYLDEAGVEQEGYAWNEMYDFSSSSHDEMVARDALSVIAAFISHCDNFNGNQGLICIDKKEGEKKNHNLRKSECDGLSQLYIHDVGGTLGYGWKISHLDFWPDYMHLEEWVDLNTWKDSKKCQVHVNGIPGCSWSGKLQVSEEGRALAARLLGKLTDQQIVDLFTSARANLMRGESVQDWINGFQEKMKRDIFGTTCGK